VPPTSDAAHDTSTNDGAGDTTVPPTIDGSADAPSDATPDTPDASDAPNLDGSDAQTNLDGGAESAAPDAAFDGAPDAPADSPVDAPADAPSDAPAVGHARLRIANLTRRFQFYATKLDFCLRSDAAPSFVGVPHMRAVGVQSTFSSWDVSEYVTVDAGRTVVRLVAEGATDCGTRLSGSSDFTTDVLADGEAATVIATDGSGGTTLHAIHDLVTPPTSGSMSLRFVHVEQTSGTISVFRGAGILSAPLLTGLAFEQTPTAANAVPGGPAIDTLGYASLKQNDDYVVSRSDGTYLGGFRDAALRRATVFVESNDLLACPEGETMTSNPHVSACWAVDRLYPVRTNALRLVNLAPAAANVDLCIRTTDDTTYLPEAAFHRSGNRSGIGYREMSGLVYVPSTRYLALRAVPWGQATHCDTATPIAELSYFDPAVDTVVLHATAGGAELRGYRSLPNVTLNGTQAAVALVHASSTGRSMSLWAGTKEVARGVQPLASASGTSDAVGIVHMRIAVIDVVPTGGSDVVLADQTSHSFFWYAATGVGQSADTLVRCRDSAQPVDFKTACDVVPQ
jgi:hypothetical protein